MINISANATSGINRLTTIDKISTFRGDILLKIRMPMTFTVLQKAAIQHSNVNGRQASVTDLPGDRRINEVVVPVQGIIGSSIGVAWVRKK